MWENVKKKNLVFVKNLKFYLKWHVGNTNKVHILKKTAKFRWTFIFGRLIIDNKLHFFLDVLHASNRRQLKEFSKWSCRCVTKLEMVTLGSGNYQNIKYKWFRDLQWSIELLKKMVFFFKFWIERKRYCVKILNR